MKMVVAAAAACLLVACSPGAHPSAGSGSAVNADIAKVSAVKSSFGPEFKVTDVPERAIDPSFFSAHKLPQGLTFEPPSCAKVAAGPDMPPGVQGKMAAVSAEGNGNRFVVIAVETSEPLPLSDPGPDCKKVAFSGAQLRGGLEVVDAPRIDGTQTQGVHRVLQAFVDGAPHTGELYNYAAQFGYYQVWVVANPLVVPGQQLVPVDKQRARDLLGKAVAAIRG